MRGALPACSCLVGDGCERSAAPLPSDNPSLHRSTCPCGAEFDSFAGLSAHVDTMHSGPTRNQLNREYMVDSFHSRHR